MLIDVVTPWTVATCELFKRIDRVEDFTDVKTFRDAIETALVTPAIAKSYAAESGIVVPDSCSLVLKPLFVREREVHMLICGPCEA